jgi:hypothetical protein
LVIVKIVDDVDARQICGQGFSSALFAAVGTDVDPIITG